MLKLYTKIFHQYCLFWFITIRTKGLLTTPQTIVNGKGITLFPEKIVAQHQ